MVDDLSRAIRDGVRSGIEQSTGGIVETCLNALWEHPWYPFIAGGQLRLIEMGMKPAEAWKLSRETLTEYVRSEKIAFGDPAYDWGPNGGRDVVQECEIDHWESAP